MKRPVQHPFGYAKAAQIAIPRSAKAQRKRIHVPAHIERGIAAMEPAVRTALRDGYRLLMTANFDETEEEAAAPPPPMKGRDAKRSTKRVLYARYSTALQGPNLWADGAPGSTAVQDFDPRPATTDDEGEP